VQAALIACNFCQNGSFLDNRAPTARSTVPNWEARSEPRSLISDDLVRSPRLYIITSHRKACFSTSRRTHNHVAT
jgi:hypothetical protein